MSVLVGRTDVAFSSASAGEEIRASVAPPPPRLGRLGRLGRGPAAIGELCPDLQRLQCFSPGM